MNCTDNLITIPDYFKAILGINAGLTSVRLMQVESVADYFDCESEREIDTPEALIRLLMDTNHCDRPTLRVDISTDDGLCVNFIGCNNAENDWFTDLKNAVGRGADGAPVLRIMLSSGLS